MMRRFLMIPVMLLAANASMAEVETLKVTHFLSPNSTAQKLVLEPWCNDINKASDGRLVCQFFPAMQLGGTPSQLPDQVQHGVADIAWIVPGYTAGRFPRTEAIEMPFLLKDGVSGAKTAWAYYEQYAREDYAAHKLLALHTDGGIAFHTTSQPITKLEDLKGIKLRSGFRLAGEMIKAFGGVPVTIPAGQLTEALSKGVVDGVQAAWELVITGRLDEVTQYHVQPKPGLPYPAAGVLALVMNKARYESLPADLRSVLDEHSGMVLSERFGRAFDTVASEARELVIKSGKTISSFDESQIKKMVAMTKSVEEQWIKEANAKGLDGEKLVEAVRSIASQY